MLFRVEKGIYWREIFIHMASLKIACIAHRTQSDSSYHFLSYTRKSTDEIILVTMGPTDIVLFDPRGPL